MTRVGENKNAFDGISSNDSNIIRLDQMSDNSAVIVRVPEAGVKEFDEMQSQGSYLVRGFNGPAGNKPLFNADDDSEIASRKESDGKKRSFIDSAEKKSFADPESPSKKDQKSNLEGVRVLEMSDEDDEDDPVRKGSISSPMNEKKHRNTVNQSSSKLKADLLAIHLQKVESANVDSVLSNSNMEKSTPLRESADSQRKSDKQLRSSYSFKN